jgi:diacylglycerol kinase (ATP)
MKPYLAIVNPAAGGGRCGKLANAVIEDLRARGVPLDVKLTRVGGEGVQLALEAYREGYRRFIAVGGDGTSYEIVNGLFSTQVPGERVALGFLPLGTGNSFLRDFGPGSMEYARASILSEKSRPCDVLRLKHKTATLYYINLLSIGFTAEAGELTNRYFKRLREAGYLASILLCWLRLHYPIFPLRLDGDPQLDRFPCTYLTFSNSQYTGGNLLIAPFADTADGLIEITRVGTIRRWDFARTFPKIFTGAHMQHPLIMHRKARRVDFHLDHPIDVMIDGEVLRCHPESIEVLPSALDVMV